MNRYTAQHYFELWRIHKLMNKVLSDDSLYDCLSFHVSMTQIWFSLCLGLSARSQGMLYEGHWISKTHTHTHTHACFSNSAGENRIKPSASLYTDTHPTWSHYELSNLTLQRLLGEAGAVWRCSSHETQIWLTVTRFVTKPNQTALT